MLLSMAFLALFAASANADKDVKEDMYMQGLQGKMVESVPHEHPPMTPTCRERHCTAATATARPVFISTGISCTAAEALPSICTGRSACHTGKPMMVDRTRERVAAGRRRSSRRPGRWAIVPAAN